MKNIIMIILLLTLVSGMLYSQTITHPWWVIDRGGRKSTADTLILHTSIGQPIVQKMAYLDTDLESGFVPGLRTLSGTYTPFEFDVVADWNMISLPLILTDYRKTALFPTAISTAFCYNGSYEEQDTLENGYGYWLKFSSDHTVPMSGTTYLTDTIDVSARWNIIGPTSYPVRISDIMPIPPIVIQSSYFGYNGTYVEEDTLEPGKGYWVKVNEAGKLVLNGIPIFRSSPPMAIAKAKRNLLNSSSLSKFAKEQQLNNLIITDAEEKSVILYFSSTPSNVDLTKYELPPPPPSGSFDVRFASQRTIEMADRKRPAEVQQYPIIISGGKDPMIFEWDITSHDGNYTLMFIRPEKKPEERTLSGHGKLSIQSSDLLGIKLLVAPGATVELPKEFALAHAYPNPFNPSTTIKYQLPIDSRVTLKVYNVLGQVTVTLAEEIQPAGYQSVDWNAGDVASGVYFYRLEATSISDPGKKFTQVRKMILMK